MAAKTALHILKENFYWNKLIFQKTGYADVKPTNDFARSNYDARREGNGGQRGRDLDNGCLVKRKLRLNVEDVNFENLKPL